MTLSVTDIDTALDARLVRKVEAACRNVKLSPNGYFVRHIRQGEWPAPDWRGYYAKLAQKFFPNAWVYRGGRHIAVHASPPAEPRRISRHQVAPGGEAGRCLFRIIESL